MRGVVPLVLLCLLAAAGAGCVGDSAVSDTDTVIPVEADEPVVTEATGSIRGQVLTLDLEPVAGADVSLVAEGATEALMATRTDIQGRFTFNGVEPARYRLHMADPCCQTLVQDVVVQAGTVSELSYMVDRLVSILPYVVMKEWTGFISCGVGSVNACYTDPQNNKEIYPVLSKDLKTVVVGMQWQSTALLTEDLALNMDRWQVPEYHYDYIAVTGPSPLRERVDDGTIEPEDARFSQITDEGLKIRFIVNGPQLGVIYQQAFTLYWQEHYHAPAPDDVDPIPEG